jgi:hypothetical protein
MRYIIINAKVDFIQQICLSIQCETNDIRDIHVY